MVWPCFNVLNAVLQRRQALRRQRRLRYGGVRAARDGRRPRVRRRHDSSQPRPGIRPKATHPRGGRLNGVQVDPSRRVHEHLRLPGNPYGGASHRGGRTRHWCLLEFVNPLQWLLRDGHRPPCCCRCRSRHRTVERRRAIAAAVAARFGVVVLLQLVCVSVYLRGVREGGSHGRRRACRRC